MMMDKKSARLRRARRTRIKIRELRMHRLSVHRTPRHIYAQIVTPDGASTLVAASTVEREVRTEVGNGGNVEAAKVIGKRLAEKAKARGITNVAFDRAGFRYHGRVKALAEAARENGLEF